MTISEESKFTEAGPELNINAKMAWNELKTFCMPKSCALCPIGFQEFDCGRNTPFNDEDYNSRPSTCKLKLVGLNDIVECANNTPHINVGDTAAVRAICECVCVIPCREECRNICPFEDDCEFEECDNNNEKIFVTKVESIFNNGHGWMVTFEGLSIEARIEDLGISFFIGEDAEQKAKEYEKTLNLLDEIQSSDIKQIIHAEWINVPAGIPLLKLGHRYDDWKCSNCGTIADVRNSHNLGKYCSHCGAAMKGV